MHYLFGFSGRINRAKMWLFILVTLVWEMVIGLIAVFGLNWSSYVHEISTMAHEGAPMRVAFPWPDPVGGTGLIVLGVVAALGALYFVSLLAVYTKRLHDRNKSAWWLLPFAVIPFGLSILQVVAMPGLWAMGAHFGPLGLGWGAAHLIGTVLGLWAFIELFFFRGTAGENQYGPDPLAK